MQIDREIYFIRHGETEWNNLGLGQGARNNIELNKTGREQSRLTGKYLKDYRIDDKQFDLVLCSPMLRAKETAEIICKQIKYDPKKIKYFDELVELDHGLLSIGKTDEELKKDKFYDDYFKMKKKIKDIIDPIENIMTYKFSNDTVKPNNKYEVETLDSLLKRCKKIINLIKKSKYKKIMIVCHGGIILNGFITLLFNTYQIRGDYTYGGNCHITYVVQQKNKFNLMTAPNTLHFAIYDKNYNKKNNE